MRSLITFPKLLLFVGIMCLALASWALLQGEFREAIFGFGLGALLLLIWRWALAQSASRKLKEDV